MPRPIRMHDLVRIVDRSGGAGNKPCPPVTDQRVKFLLTMLVESRWSGLTYKLLHRHRHHRGLMNAGVPVAADPAAAAVVVGPPAPPLPAVDLPIPPNMEQPAMEQPAMEQPAAAPPEIPPTANIPLCPQCGRPMLMRRNRRNHGLFWGCVAYPGCRGTRRPGDTGYDQRQRR